MAKDLPEASAEYKYESQRAYLNELGAQIGAKRMSFDAMGAHLAQNGSPDLGKQWSEILEFKQQHSRIGMGPWGYLSQGDMDDLRALLQKHNQRLADSLGLSGADSSPDWPLMPDLKARPALVTRLGATADDLVDDYRLQKEGDLGWSCDGNRFAESDIADYMGLQGDDASASAFKTATTSLFVDRYVIGGLAWAAIIIGGNYAFQQPLEEKRLGDGLVAVLGGFALFGTVELVKLYLRHKPEQAVERFNEGLKARILNGTAK